MADWLNKNGLAFRTPEGCGQFWIDGLATNENHHLGREEWTRRCVLGYHKINDTFSNGLPLVFGGICQKRCQQRFRGE